MVAADTVSPSGDAAQPLVFDFAEGHRDMAALLGGKGANLAEMTRLGLPVPAGFTITTRACRHYLSHGEEPSPLRGQVTSAIRRLEDQLGRRLGDVADPLLVSVRSGAQVSMPGMMETVLNVGLNDGSVKGLAAAAADERFAWDSYRRLIQMLGSTVFGISSETFASELAAVRARSGAGTDAELPVGALHQLVEVFKAIVAEHAGRPFPQNAREQLDLAIRAVFESWNTDRARQYRNRQRIPHDLGTAVTVCAMVFGNRGMHSGTGVCFTHDPTSGRSGLYGDYLVNAQGEDIVSGVRNTLSLPDMAARHPTAYAELTRVARLLQAHYRDLCDIEFTVENGKLWILQTRIGQRSAAAAFRIAARLVDENVITLDEALTRVTGHQLGQLMFSQFDAHTPRTPLTRGIAASPGAAVGRVVFDSAAAVRRAGLGEHVLLCRRETKPDDLRGLIASVGVLTSRGGKTSHAAVVARGMGRACVCGAEEIEVDPAARLLRVGPVTVREDDMLSIDGSTGEVFTGALPVVPSPTMTYLEHGRTAAMRSADADARELIGSVDRLLRHADQTRRLRVRANADTASDAARARRLGAQGIGLCRTEHMFLGERQALLQRLILADTPETRDAALAELLECQRVDFTALLRETEGMPATIRLLDPPLHEFLPDRTTLAVEVALARAADQAIPEREKLLAAVERLHETNPMLGMRGVRLGLLLPELFATQVRALAEATASLIRDGQSPHVEIMVPLIASAAELRLIREPIERAITEVAQRTGAPLTIPIGTMIELPRAALTAHDIAQAAEFFSFGTNDLTQTTWGLSRDDVQTALIAAYQEQGVFSASPFDTLDRDGVGVLIDKAVTAGRAARHDLTLGICGEHGADPDSVHFFHAHGLDYVSCSPNQIPIARLEAGRAALLATPHQPAHP